MTIHAVIPDLSVRIEVALLDQLASDPQVRERFGAPARLYSGRPRQPLFPYAVIDRHEQKPLPASGGGSFEHRIDLAVYTRHGGRMEARDGLGALQAAFEVTPLQVGDVHIVLAHVVYADTMRTPSLTAFRGLLRFRLISEVVI